MHARELLDQDGPLARAISGYERREVQLAMADTVEEALVHDGVALVEAGTGTGKTLAYLVPAILSGKKVVVSTGTKTLQDQIMEHDLPLLERHLGVPVSAACMKGLGNYLCLRRFEELLGSSDADLGAFARHLPMLRAWRESTVNGDRGELDALPDDAPLWPAVASSSETRIGAKCRHFDACFVTKMRRDAERAQVIVVNHHLFFADLATRGPHGGGVIPDYDAVVFDEAHQVEDVATDFFGVRVSSQRIETFVRDAQRTLQQAKRLASAEPLLRSALDAAAGFFGSLPRSAAEQGRAALDVASLSPATKDAMYALDAALEAVAARTRLASGDAGDEVLGAGEAIAGIARRAEQLRHDVAEIADGSRSHQRVTWIEQRGRGVSVGASPVDVADVLRDEVLHRTRAVVFTSATLATGGDFRFAKKRLGIGDDVDELIVPSPFDWPSQAALYLPKSLPDPREPTFLDAATDELLHLVALTGGGAFVLCTSHRAMQQLASRATGQLRQTVFVQGSAPKSVLLDRFRADGHAVLFATNSFWEGVDVPGDALRLVIIDKLPFGVPTDPLLAARCARIDEEGGSSFMDYLVPSAAIALKQGFGRLIRTRKDRGIVAVLDKRVVTKGYGKVFLQSLPPARRCATREDVEAFWRGAER